jgi:hypothetical protein
MAQLNQIQAVKRDARAFLLAVVNNTRAALAERTEAGALLLADDAAEAAASAGRTALAAMWNDSALVRARRVEAATLAMAVNAAGAGLDDDPAYRATLLATMNHPGAPLANRIKAASLALDYENRARALGLLAMSPPRNALNRPIEGDERLH